MFENKSAYYQMEADAASSVRKELERDLRANSLPKNPLDLLNIGPARAQLTWMEGLLLTIDKGIITHGIEHVRDFTLPFVAALSINVIFTESARRQNAKDSINSFIKSEFHQS